MTFTEFQKWKAEHRPNTKEDVEDITHIAAAKAEAEKLKAALKSGGTKLKDAVD